MIDVYDIDILAKLPHNLTAQTPLSYIKHLDMTSSFISHSHTLPEIRNSKILFVLLQKCFL